MKRSAAHAVETFTIGFDEPSFDETPFAAQVAEIFGTRHHSRAVSAGVTKILGILVSHAEEPFADNSAIPFYLLSEVVRRNVTVALSGDGADELLAGYDTYRATGLAPYYRLLPGWLRRGLIRPLVRHLPISHRKYGASMLLNRFAAGAELPFPKDHCSWRRIVSPELRNRLLTSQIKSTADGDPLDVYARVLEDAPDWLSPLEKQLHLDLRFHLPNDMLVKVDRMSMAHALEVRVPFLDLEVVRTCLAIPPAHKRAGKRGKLVLKEMLRPDLPPELVERPKAGFLIPLERWLQRDWQPLLNSVLTREFAEQTGAFHWPVLEGLIQDHASGRADHAYALFALLVLGIWWRVWVTGEMAAETRRPAAAPVRISRLQPESSLSP
jgi:asparagine synthase (glutamine-hydrolysing)